MATGWLGHGPCHDVAEAGADGPGGWRGAQGRGQGGEPLGKPGRGTVRAGGAPNALTVSVQAILWSDHPPKSALLLQQFYC